MYAAAAERAQLVGIGGVGFGVDGAAEVFGNDVGDLGTVVCKGALEVGSNSNVAGLALPPGEVVVDDSAHQALGELQVTPLR